MGPGSAEQREERCTASGTLVEPPLDRGAAVDHDGLPGHERPAAEARNTAEDMFAVFMMQAPGWREYIRSMLRNLVYAAVE